MKYKEYRKKSRILIVDDEPSIHFMLKQFLKDIDNLFFASNGIEAIEILKTQDIHIVVTDIKMPEMDGIELLKYIKEVHTDIRSIVISGHGEKTEAINSLRLGAFDFLTKPFQKIEILKSLDRLISENYYRNREKYFQNSLMKKNLQLKTLLDDFYLIREDLSDAKKMAPGLAHEVRNPMMVILMRLELLEKEIHKEDADNNKTQEHINSLKKSTKNMNDIISSMLNLYKSESKLKLEEVSVTKIIIEAKAALEDYITKNIDIRYEIEDELLQIDRTNIVQLIYNLMKNAYEEISHQDGPWIKIKTIIKSEGHIIQISDSGTGMPEEIKKSLFKTSITTKKEDKGHGLGLLICKRIVEAHEGSIKVLTDLENTTFEIFLPRR